MIEVLADIGEIGYDLVVSLLGLSLYVCLDIAIKVKRSDYFGKIYRVDPGLQSAIAVLAAYFWHTPFAHAGTLIWLFSVSILGGIGELLDALPYGDTLPLEVDTHSHQAMFFAGTFVHITLDKISGILFK